MRNCTQRAAHRLDWPHEASATVCNEVKTRAKSLSSIRNPLLYPAELRAKLPPASVTCKFSQVSCDEIDHACHRTRGDRTTRGLWLVADGKSKRERRDECFDGDRALQVRRLVGIRRRSGWTEQGAFHCGN